MADRRSLTEGLKPQIPAPSVDPQVERDFVHGSKTKPQTPIPSPVQSSPHTRVPLSTRIRAESSQALKKASLQRQLEGIETNSLQGILEEALEPWLRSNGYIR
ncbi:MAG: hypothetical protein ACTHLZ_16980 [Tepidisphaeraceae bacterium]